MKIVKINKLFFKNGYILNEITQEQAYELSLNEQVYVKKNGVAYPATIVKCFENAPKFGIEFVAWFITKRKGGVKIWKSEMI